MTTVYVENLEIYGYVGVTREEREVGHRLRLTIAADCGETAWQTDEVVDTVDYSRLAAIAADLITRLRPKTLEHLAQCIADQILVEFPTVATLTLDLAKHVPPMPQVTAAAGIRRAFNR